MYAWHRWPLFFRGRLALIYELTGAVSMVVHPPLATAAPKSYPPSRNGRWDAANELLLARQNAFEATRAVVSAVVDAWLAHKSKTCAVVDQWENESQLEATALGVEHNGECLLARAAGPIRTGESRPLLLNARRHSTQWSAYSCLRLIADRLTQLELPYVPVKPLRRHHGPGFFDYECLQDAWRGAEWRANAIRTGWYSRLGFDIVGGWQRGGLRIVLHHAAGDIEACEGEVYADGECVAAQLPGQRIALVSARKYRQETEPALVRDAVRRALVARKAPFADVRPAPGPGLARLVDLRNAWNDRALKLSVSAGAPVVE